MFYSIRRHLNGKNVLTPQSGDDSEIDITPLLDVVFIMLVFFIVTASFIKEEGVGINKPSTDAMLGEPPSIRPIVLDINANNEITIQGLIVPVLAIKPTITRIKAESPKAEVVVTLHPKVRTRTFIAAIDGLRSANIILPSVNLRAS